MKKSLIILPAVILSLILIQFLDFSESAAEPPQGKKAPHQFTIDKSPANSDAMRIGVVLGGQTNYGAEQFSKNIVFNPGFEGDFVRFVVIVSQADEESFSNEGWEHPDGFWDGAAFDIRTGPSAGTTGKIKSSLKSGANGQPQYFSEEPLPRLEPKDVIILSKDNVGKEQPDQWWVNKKTREGITAVEDHRPGSHGVQAAELTVLQQDSNALISYIDHAGKYLKIEGGWRLSFWAKSPGGKGSLRVSFRRLNEKPPFIVKEVSLTDEWQKYDLNFVAHDAGKPAILSLEFAPLGTPGSKIYLDDVWLGSMEDNSRLAFRKEVVGLLKELHPSYLRDWQGQNSDSYKNRVASPSARKNFAMPPTDGIFRGFNWTYSLPEFLDLCEEVKANPWIVLPVTLSDIEYKEIGKVLAQIANKDRFSNIIVEFGNENWNWIFRPAGIPYPEPHGKTFERAMAMIQSELGPDVNMIKAVNGQYANPWLTMQYAQFAPSADLMGVAEYYVAKIDSTATQKNAIAAFFSNDLVLKQILENLKPTKKSLGMYETNAGSVSGSMPPEDRNPLVAGAISGSFLAKHLLEALFLGVQPDMVFTFSQIETGLTDIPNGKVKLWGITVDLSPTLRFRPTGLAVKMLNRVIGGGMYRALRVGSVPLEQLTIAAFKENEGWKLAAVLENENAQEVEVKFPDDGTPLPSTAWVIDSKTPFDMNDDADNVKIKEIKLQPSGRSLIFTISGYGLLVAF